jgi:sulfatase modifying factor 1
MNRLTRAALTCAALALTTNAACGGGRLSAPPPAKINEQLEAAKPDVATCAAAKDPDNPFIVEWSGANLSALEAASQQGLVVVSYDCSALKVLTGCKAEGAYTLAALTPSRDGFEVSSKDELFARLPLGALSLQAEVSQARSLRLDYVITGQKRATPERPKRVSGKCDGATHFIKAITVGAFALDARAGSGVGAGLTIGGVGGGAGTSGESKRLKGSGDVAACDTDDAITRARCVAPLQVRLEAISIADIGLERAGFGRGLGELTTSAPVIPDVAEFSGGVGAMSFADADTELLDLWQAALRAEKSKTSKTGDKLRAWEGVVAHKGGKHQQIETAKERRAAWAERKAAEDEAQRAQAKRCSDLHGVASQKAADEAKLAKLLAYDDDVISAAQKGAYRRELEQVYARWAGPLKELDGRCRSVEYRLPSGELHRADDSLQRADGTVVYRDGSVMRTDGTVALRDGSVRMPDGSVQIPEGSVRLRDGSVRSRDGWLREPKAGVAFRESRASVSLGQSEVTVAQYEACVNAGPCRDTFETGGYCNYGSSRDGEHPMNCVDWNGADAFCQWVGGRLPTEDEWYAEASARSKYPWGDTEATCERAVMDDGGEGCGRESTWPVCSKPAGNSMSGLCDMSGNVWEWTSTQNGAGRVLRGGGWVYASQEALSAAGRRSSAPSVRGVSFGFRCARPRN